MLHYQKTAVSKGIDVNKKSALKECKLCHYWFFKDIGFKFEKHVCNKCHDLLTMAYSLKNLAILSAKGAAIRCLLVGTSKNEALRKTNNSVTYDKTPIEMIKQGAFGGTYSRDIYSGINEKWYKNSSHGKNLFI